VKKDAAQDRPGRSGIRPEASEHAYLQVAEAIRQRIASGQYQHDERIPSEKELCREFGLSLLTVRQAVGLLAGEGVLRKIPSKGTYVRKMDWQAASFYLRGLDDYLAEGRNTKVKILKARMEKMPDELAGPPGFSPGERVVRVERLLTSEELPIIVQESFLPCDPRRPIMESELEATYMAGLFTGGGSTGLIKNAAIDIRLGGLSQRRANLLGRPVDDKVFVLEYIFFDLSDRPVSQGSFWVVPEIMHLSGRVGLWPGGGGQ